MSPAAHDGHDTVEIDLDGDHAVLARHRVSAPLLGCSRRRARGLVEPLGLSAPAAGMPTGTHLVNLDCARLRVCTEAFADELVRAALVAPALAGRDSVLIVRDGAQNVRQALLRAAGSHTVSHRIICPEPAPA